MKTSIRLPLLSLVSLLVCALAVAPAGAVQSKQGMKVSAKIKKGNLSLFVNPFLTLDTTDQPFATTRAVIMLDRDIRINSAKFPSCAEGPILLGQCPAGSQVGAGKALGKALALPAVPAENLTVTAYNGPEGKSLNLLVQGDSPLPIKGVIIGKLSKVSGRYGYKLDFTIPENLQQPAPGVIATLVGFETTIFAKQGLVPYLQTKSCKKLDSFSGIFTFTDGTSQTTPRTKAKC